MKKKEFDQLKGMSLPELKEKLAKARSENGKARMEISQSKQKNVHLYLAKRKEIAKILTLISEKSLLSLPEGKVNKETEAKK